MEDTLSVGDIVCFYAEESGGFVFATQSSSLFAEVAVGARQSRVRPRIPDQQVIAFELCIANRYKLNKRYRKLKAKSDENPKDLSLKNEAAQAKIGADAENEDNALEQKRQLGKKLLYGQIIQLKHMFTDKYIQVSTTKTSKTESNNMEVELSPYDSKHAQFKIMPRYKVKAEGDVVQVDDQVVLESVKSPGQYLHVSRRLLGKEFVYSDSYELNLSVRQSGFTVYRKYKPTFNDEDKVKVGSLVRFFHKEMEAYLVAEGLFDDELVEDVHLRMRPIDQNNPRTMFPSSSALTYWQIELQKGPVSDDDRGLYSGGILKWEQQCRIIHACTRQYLTVQANGNVTLTSDHTSPDTVFRLHAVIRDSDDISFETYCRVEHVVTGFWLHALSDEYQRKSNAEKEKSKDDSMASLKYTTAQLKKVTAIPEKQYDDAFTLQMVDPELVQIFHYMAGMVPFIQKLVSDKKNGVVLNAKQAEHIVLALREMKDFMIVNSIPSKNRQKLMRNLRIVELLVSLLRIPYRGCADQGHLTAIFVEAYDVLYTYLMGNSRKNELYIAKYIDFFLTQFEYKEGNIGLNAAHMVMELIRDNRKIVDRITHSHIDKFVELLHRDKNYRYLDLLSVLCVCDGVSISDNQKYITEAWLMRGNKDGSSSSPPVKNCVYLTDLGQKIGKTQGVVYVSTNNGRLWKELQNFAKVLEMKDRTEAQTEEYLFLEHQLELFGMLAHGQNEFAMEVITKKLDYLTWEEAFTCLSDDRLPDRLRAKYCELIITLFVDIGNNVSVVDRVKLSYVYDDIDQKEMSKTLKDLVDKTSSETYQYFPELRDWISKFLATNGDMTASDIGNNMLVEQVLRLVHYLVKYGFYSRSEDIRELLKPMLSMLDGRNDKPSTGHHTDEVLRHFRQTDRFRQSPETKAITDAKIQSMRVLDLFFNFIFNLRMEKFMNLFKVTHGQSVTPGVTFPELGAMLSEQFDIEESPVVCRTALRRLKDIFDETAFFHDVDLTAILHDASQYQYDEMVRKSMHLLNRYYSAHRTLFSRAVQAQVLITPDSIQVGHDLDTMLPKLRRLATSKLNSEQTEELADILHRLAQMCHLKDEEDEEHGMNQSILYNYGVLEDAFTILAQEIDVKLLEQYSGLRKIFQKTFLLLKAMARNNKVVQVRLFDRLEMLLSKEGAPVELAEALTEVFTGNSNTCMKVTGYQVQKIMALVAQHQAQVPQLLDLLNAVVKVEELDLPLKRNQSYVMTYFMQFRSDIASVVDRDEKERLKILTDFTSDELDYLIAMVDLLATCAEGENRFIESICQTIFKIPELLRMLTNKGIENNLKRPFLRFLLWVYMNTAGGMVESGAGDLPHDKLLWEYLGCLNEDLKRVTEYTQQNPGQVKQLLKRPPCKRGGDSGPRARDVSPSEEMRGTLHYLFDGVMPFLQVFCKNFYHEDVSLFPDEPEMVAALAKTFEEFMEAIAPLISIERQMKNLIAAMTSMLTVSRATKTSNLEEFQAKNAHRSSDIRSDARKAYEAYYENEEEINTMLNIFSVNMQAAYGGRNDVQTQTGFPSTKDYSEMGGDEELPLGQEFQEHMQSFIDTTAHSPMARYARAEKLVQQLSISSSLTHLSEEEKLQQVELDVACLQLLRGLLHNEIVKLPDDWELATKENDKQLRVIVDVQSALNSYDAITSTLAHLSRPQDNIVRELLAFLAALLFGGNDDVQTSMFGYFTGTREETFFFAIKSRMQLSALATRERRQLYAMHSNKIEEIISQARSLRKAMREGRMGADEQVAAAELGSMLSMARHSTKQSRLNIRGSRMHLGGSRGSLKGSKAGKTATLGLGSQLMVPGLSGPMDKANGSALKVGSAPVKAKKKSEVAPKAREEEIAIEDVDDRELRQAAEAAMMKDFEFKDDGFIELVLRILGLMCDNQHAGLQDYLREQPDNIKSVNLVAETTRFLNILYSSISSKTVPLTVQVFDTLTEYTSGNQSNQVTVFDNKVCDYINHILRVGAYKDCTRAEVYKLKMSIAVLIRALTEENPAEVQEHANSFVQEVMECLDSETLMNVMMDTYNDIQNTPMDQRDTTDAAGLYSMTINVGFAYFHILSRKCDLDPDVSREYFCKTPEQEQAWNYFQQNTLSVEIVKNDVLQKIHFRVTDKNVLREEIKDKFKYEVDRTSPSNKLRDFMEWSSAIIADIKIQRRIHSFKLAKIIVQSWFGLNVAVMILSFAIALLVFVSWEADTSDNSNPVPIRSKYPGAIIMTYVLGGIHNVLSFFILVSFFLNNHPTFPTAREMTALCRRFRKKTPEEMEEEKKETANHLQVRFFGFLTFYYLIFFALSICGTILYGYFFSFHLLHIAMMNQLLKRVIMAVTRNGLSLLLVAILALAVLYIYALISFAFLRDFLEQTNGRQCETILQCFVTMVHHGLVEGMYTTMEQQLTNRSFEETVGVTIYDLSFFIIITTIGLNIVFGIIVDTFSELRDSKWQIDNDMKTTCFICSRESYDFERHADGFEKHVKEEHNQWAYLFFFIHLDETRPNDYSALELHVYRSLEKNNFDFFPLNRALSLQHEEDSNEKKLEMLMSQVEYMVTKMKEEEATREREKEKQRQLEWETKHRAQKK